ncbi:hypothetical protein D1871_23100 [Nakamurella silvestris]|nr:hypothetical protein D1871_23100 [Nakamurella silvestris]
MSTPLGEPHLIYTEATGRGGKRYAYFLCRGRQEGVCKLPHLGVRQVERMIEDHYATVAIEPKVLDQIRHLISGTLAEEAVAARQVHKALTDN